MLSKKSGLVFLTPFSSYKVLENFSFSESGKAFSSFIGCVAQLVER
jgi:hypothetical protein|tara:strand:- start:11392 stop:11529 length:138 start_codon:yes stop_codon:yes gene_type:complete